MKIKDLLVWGQKKLTKQKKYLNPQKDAEEILAFVLKKNRNYLYLNEDKKVKIWELLKYKYYIVKRSKLYPLAYILGEWNFYNLKLKMKENVFIPRPETELLVEEVLNFLKVNEKNNFTIFEIGIGSGAIATALLKNAKNIDHYFFSDINKKVIDLAKENLSLQQIKKEKYTYILLDKEIKFDFNYLDYFDSDILISNPPYISYEKYLNSPTIKYEAQEALFADKNNPIIFYEELFKYLKNRNKNYKFIILELDEDLANAVFELANNELANYKIKKIKKDYQNLDRFLIFEN